MGGAVENFTLTYVALSSTLSLALFLLGEQRVDAYVALNILVYYICYAVMRPSPGRSLLVRAFNIALLSVMCAVIAVRVYEVLKP